MDSLSLLESIHLFTTRREIEVCFENFFTGIMPICLHSCINSVNSAFVCRDGLFVDPKITNGDLLNKLVPVSFAKKLFFVLLQSEVLPFLQATGLPYSSVIPVPCDEEVFRSRRIHFEQKLSLKNIKLSAFENKILSECVGESNFVKKLRQEIAFAARSNLPVLLTGESGTGKSFSASCIHRLSARRKNPFFVLDMGSFPEGLADSSLFGSVCGAFTGASNSEGLLAQADRGSLFLDEITNTPLSVQAKLLRFLETGMIRSVGAVKEKKINTKLIFAANEDFHVLIKQKRFRSDLYNRINVIHIKLLPLREHPEDIGPITLAFLNKKACHITRKALSILENYHWPANIRQLEQCLARTVLYCRNKCIEAENIILDY